MVPERGSAVSSAEHVIDWADTGTGFTALQLDVDIDTDTDGAVGVVNTTKHCFASSTVPVSQQRSMTRAMRTIA